jgi:hypothetical protein
MKSTISFYTNLLLKLSFLRFYRGSVVVAVLLAMVRPVITGLTTTNSTPTVKPEAATAAVELPMMGVRMPKTR